MKNETIKIMGMSCGHCQAQVEKVLRTLPGMVSVEVKLREGEAIVSYDEKKLSREDLSRVIAEAGYETDY